MIEIGESKIFSRKPTKYSKLLQTAHDMEDWNEKSRLEKFLLFSIKRTKSRKILQKSYIRKIFHGKSKVEESFDKKKEISEIFMEKVLLEARAT